MGLKTMLITVNQRSYHITQAFMDLLNQTKHEHTRLELVKHEFYPCRENQAQEILNTLLGGR